MLGINQLDFLSYTTAFKGNYRKGIHKLEAILSTKAHAEELARNKGGVSVIFGVPVDAPDKNSDTLLALLLGSNVADQAVETFLACFYEFDTLDTLLKVNATCQAIQANPITKRAAGGSSVVIGKLVATLAGLSCASYANMEAVAANSTAMRAVAASSTAMTAVAASSIARNAIYASSTAKAALDNSPLKVTVRATYSTQNNNQYTNLNRKAFILKTTGSGSGTWTFFNVYNPPTSSSTTSIDMGAGNAFSLYLVGTTITTQHGGGSSSDYIDIQYIPV